MYLTSIRFRHYVVIVFCNNGVCAVSFTQCTCSTLPFHGFPKVISFTQSLSLFSLETFDNLPRAERRGRLFQTDPVLLYSALSHNASGSMGYLFTPIISHAVFRVSLERLSGGQWDRFKPSLSSLGFQAFCGIVCV